MFLFRPTTIDLFSGSGGLTQGFKYQGFRSLAAVDFVSTAAESFKKNHQKTTVFCEDINNPNLLQKVKIATRNNKVHVICGGPPCEGFSLAGKRDPNDPRNNLFINLLIYADAFVPDVILMENVGGLLSMKNGDRRTIDFIKQKFFEHGYQCDYVILNACDFGVPQIRKRLFIIGTKDSRYKTIVSMLKGLKKGETVTVWDAISDLPPLKPGQTKSYYNSEALNPYQETIRNSNVYLTGHRAVNHTSKVVKRYSYLRYGDSVSNMWKVIPSGIKPYKKYTARGRRLDPKKPSPTVTSHCLDELVHPYQDRGITPREAARLQSFPDNYIFEGPYVTAHGAKVLDQYEQVGDAVPPLLAEKLAYVIKKVL